MNTKTLLLTCYICLGLVCNAFSNDRYISAGLRVVPLKRHKEPIDLSIYHDTISYSKSAPFGDKHGRATNVHETVHGINSQLRNDFYKMKVNAFYAGNGYAILLSNPNLRLRQIKNHVPQCLRGYRFKLYFEDQLQYWDETPTYHIDEWSAYIAGAECAVDDYYNQIKEIEKSDHVSGVLEFSIYCTALCLATKQLDSNFWKTNDQLKETVNYFLIKSEKVFFEGKDLFPSQNQDILLNNLRTHKDSEELRSFLKTEFQGIFIE